MAKASSYCSLVGHSIQFLEGKERCSENAMSPHSDVREPFPLLVCNDSTHTDTLKVYLRESLLHKPHLALTV